jgi:hypothetical protein
MKKIGIFLAVLAGVVALASSANASECQSIADPMKRLACYDKAARTANAAAPLGETAAVNRAGSNALAAAPIVKAPVLKAPVKPGPRFWIEADGGIYDFSKNLPIIAATQAPGTTSGPIPTSPGFIGFFNMQTVPNPLITGSPAGFGEGGNYRMGYWLDPARTMAVEGSAFYVRGQSNFAVAPNFVTTSHFVNTTPAVFVHLFDDTTISTLTSAAITDQFYGADANFRQKVTPRSANYPSFDLLFGARYAALDEKLSGDLFSRRSRVYDPSLGLPGGDADNLFDYSSGTGSFRMRNQFLGPQVGFSAEQHWGRVWVSNEDKVAVGAMYEQKTISGTAVSSEEPEAPIFLAGIPLFVNANAAPINAPTPNHVGATPPSFGLFTQQYHNKLAFAVVPSGTIKAGYDVIPDMFSLTLAYNFLYMSSVGRVGDQITAPFSIRQSGFFAQGITFGGKVDF